MVILQIPPVTAIIKEHHNLTQLTVPHRTMVMLQILPVITIIKEHHNHGYTLDSTCDNYYKGAL